MSQAMSSELRALLELARQHRMTDGERMEQMVSFVYGNVALENPMVTRESVRAILAQWFPNDRKPEGDQHPSTVDTFQNGPDLALDELFGIAE